MKRPTYLNAILTVLAILMTAILWISIVQGSPFLQEAGAQVRRKPINAAERGIMPSSSAQRDKMIEALGDIREEVAQIRELLEAGGAGDGG